MSKKNKGNKIYNNTSNKYNKDDAYKTLEMINMWITNIDTKISYSLAFIGVVLGFFITNDKPIIISQVIKKILIKIQQFFNPDILSIWESIELKDIASVVIMILIFMFMFTSVKACIYLYNGIKGRIDTKIYEENGLITKSNIYWQSISDQKYINFYKNVKELDEGSLINDICSQIFINSKICTEKVSNYNEGVKYIVKSVIIYFIFTMIAFIFFK